MKSLTTTLHRLRKLLGVDGAITLRHGRLSLDRTLWWVDVWALDDPPRRLARVRPRHARPDQAMATGVA